MVDSKKFGLAVCVCGEWGLISCENLACAFGSVAACGSDSFGDLGCPVFSLDGLIWFECDSDGVALARSFDLVDGVMLLEKS